MTLAIVVAAMTTAMTPAPGTFSSPMGGCATVAITTTEDHRLASSHRFAASLWRGRLKVEERLFQLVAPELHRVAQRLTRRERETPARCAFIR